MISKWNVLIIFDSSTVSFEDFTQMEEKLSMLSMQRPDAQRLVPSAIAVQEAAFTHAVGNLGAWSIFFGALHQHYAHTVSPKTVAHTCSFPFSKHPCPQIVLFRDAGASVSHPRVGALPSPVQARATSLAPSKTLARALLM